MMNRIASDVSFNIVKIKIQEFEKGGNRKYFVKNVGNCWHYPKTGNANSACFAQDKLQYVGIPPGVEEQYFRPTEIAKFDNCSIITANLTARCIW